MSSATPPWFKPPRPERLSQPIRRCYEALEMSKLQRSESKLSELRNAGAETLAGEQQEVARRS